MTSSRRDPGAAKGNREYPIQRGPCVCSHAEVLHELKPNKTRGKCSVTDYTGPCGCRAYEEVAE